MHVSCINNININIYEIGIRMFNHGKMYPKNIFLFSKEINTLYTESYTYFQRNNIPCTCMSVVLIISILTFMKLELEKVD
jgi:hypothetical protein